MHQPATTDRTLSPAEPSSNPCQLTGEARAYLNELAADIALYGPTGDLMADMKAAHARRQTFALEMVAGKTERAKLVREAFAGYLYARAAINRSLERCELIVGDRCRREHLAFAHGMIGGVVL